MGKDVSHSLNFWCDLWHGEFKFYIYINNIIYTFMQIINEVIQLIVCIQTHCIRTNADYHFRNLLCVKHTMDRTHCRIYFPNANDNKFCSVENYTALHSFELNRQCYSFVAPLLNNFLIKKVYRTHAFCRRQPMFVWPWAYASFSLRKIEQKEIIMIIYLYEMKREKRIECKIYILSIQLPSSPLPALIVAAFFIFGHSNFIFVHSRVRANTADDFITFHRIFYWI